MFARSWLLLLAGCGSLADGNYFGEPLFTIEGTVLFSDLDLGDDDEVGVALLWANDDALSAQSVLVQTSFPARYELQIFQPPPDASRLAMRGDQPLEAHIGQILLYLDDDGSGDWDGLHEPMIGGAYNAAVLYVPGADGLAEGMPPDDPRLPLWEPSRGFHLVEVSPGPLCSWGWEQWLQPADAHAAPLHIGYYDGIASDWDCDAQNDFQDDVANPGAGAGQDLWDDTCAPDDILDDECSFVEMHLDEWSATGDDGLLDLLRDWLPELLVCHARICLETVDRAQQFL